MPKPSKILIVEDDGFLLQMYVAKLELEGYQIIVATDGEKGMRVIKKEHPDLILLDLLLPKKDGFKVLEEMKNDSAIKDIPVLVLTNLGQKEDIERCFALGAKDYLIKAHFVPSEVISRIKSILESGD
ncbi:response regulator [Patescibacteria group bacterium]|nr:response regulator [Patescibacteria group bacterium]